MKSKVFVWALPLVAAAIFWTGFQTARDDDFYAMRKNFELFGGVYEQVVSSYMVRVDPERFMRTGMDAMLETLDPWTDFLDEADNAAMQLRSQSGFGEVVINLGNRGGRVTVLSPDADVGAYRQGMRTGDAVVVVAGQSADSLTVSDVRGLLRGEPGTTVSVTVERSGTGFLDFNLKREAPVVHYVSFADRVEGTNVALVRLDAFGPGATNEIDNALEDLSQSGPLDGMILDLRDNPGGLVIESINLVGLFVPKGTPVVSTRGRAPESNRLYSTSEEPDWGDLNLTLLVNRGSASASEIVSGALQDLDRAVVIGEPTFARCRTTRQ
ncbi:MAG: carboxyl-terminal processing protease [Thalassolituus oleivorans]|jgi:carboxyl-terminal processing protease